jgi:hypothetical protein
MVLANSAWHVLSIIIIFIIGCLIITFTGRRTNTSTSRSLAIYSWHTIFCILYASYVINYGGDAVKYFNTSLKSEVDLSIGTSGIIYLTRIFTFYLDTSFLGTALVFNIFGAIGLVTFDASLRIIVSDKSKSLRLLATLIVFLPSISFWSSGIGKDSLSFLAANLALWSSLELKQRTWLLFLAILVMYFVRPHIAGIMILALAGSVAFQTNTPIKQRFLLGGTVIATAIFLIPYALNYAGVNDVSNSDSLLSYVEQRQSYNMHGGGGIDISSMTLPTQLFTYLFRPLPFEAQSLSAFAASIDNLILLFIFILGGRAIIMKRKQKRLLDDYRLFLWLYSLGCWLILAMTTANLGISLRQKWMFLPILIFLLMSVIGKSKSIIDK